jgi:hypothetical protein
MVQVTHLYRHCSRVEYGSKAPSFTIESTVQTHLFQDHSFHPISSASIYSTVTDFAKFLG